MSESTYYIQNKNAGFLGNAILFWAKGRNGYTADLNNSEIFTEEAAREICNGNPDKNKAWPVDYIDNNKGIQRIVDSQYLEHRNIRTFDNKPINHFKVDGIQYPSPSTAEDYYNNTFNKEQ